MSLTSTVPSVVPSVFHSSTAMAAVVRDEEERVADRGELRDARVLGAGPDVAHQARRRAGTVDRPQLLAVLGIGRAEVQAAAGDRELARVAERRRARDRLRRGAIAACRPEPRCRGAAPCREVELAIEHRHAGGGRVAGAGLDVEHLARAGGGAVAGPEFEPAQAVVHREVHRVVEAHQAARERAAKAGADGTQPLDRAGRLRDAEERLADRRVVRDEEQAVAERSSAGADRRGRPRSKRPTSPMMVAAPAPRRRPRARSTRSQPSRQRCAAASAAPACPVLRRCPESASSPASA